MVKRVAWGFMTMLAFGVAAYAGAAVAGIRTPVVQGLFTRTPAAALGHLVGGLVAITAGAFQINRSIRDRYLEFHRWLGRAYVVGVLGGGVSALVLAPRSGGGLVAHVGFSLLGAAWIISTVTAYGTIRGGNQDAHRDWMWRSYGLTLAAVTLRIYLPLSQMAGIDFEAAYATIAWLCWVPNLLVVEWLVIARRSQRQVMT